MFADKISLRKEMLSRRNSMIDRKHADSIIYSKLSDVCKEYKKIFTYINCKSEVNTLEFIKSSLSGQKEVYVPVCNTMDLTMTASRVDDFNSLYENEYGILEPSNPTIADIVFDVIIIPGAVFDVTGNRIGYGKGYYDKFISSLPYDLLKIAVCYDFQLLNEIPTEKHDVKMDIIITESRTVFI